MNAAETQNQSTETENQAATAARPRPERGFVTPPANIVAADNEYIIEVEMPGVDQNGLEITVEGNELTIIGRRKSDLPEGELCYCESSLADFRRLFELGPDVDASKINAKLEQGVLKLHLPKSEKAKPRRIEVKAS